MSEKAGIGGRAGVVKEGTFGVYTAPTVAVPFDTETIERTNNYTKTKSIKAGQLAQADLQHTQTTHDAAGDLNGSVLGSGFGSILNLLTGNVVTPTVVVAGTVFTTQFDVGLVSPNGKSIGVQIGRPDVNGTVRAFSYLGGKVKQLVLTMAVSDVLKHNTSFDFADEDVSQTLATPAYDTIGRELPFQGCSVKFDGVVLADCASSAKLTMVIPGKLDRFCLGGTATKKEQVLNDQITCMLELDMEFSNMTQHTAFTQATRRAVVLNCLGTLLDGTHPQQLQVTLPTTVTTKSGPVIAGPDVIRQPVTLEATVSGANPLASFLYQTSDAAIG